ncbi:MAG: signal peptidase I [Armatimonadetes bacterium]|nr:signal peptidase I [Armatimonadota bacterium]
MSVQIKGKKKMSTEVQNAVTETVVATTPKKRGMRGFGVAMLIVLGLVVFLWQTFFTIQVKGNSMLTTFHNGERLLATKAYWLVGELKRNDVVVIKGDDPGEFLIKRINRLGGEDVDFLNIPNNWSIEKGKYTVPEGDYYVLGDNAPESEDSRFFGPVEASRIVGKVIVLK